MEERKLYKCVGQTQPSTDITHDAVSEQVYSSHSDYTLSFLVLIGGDKETDT